jgi:hypothetical protein
VPSLTPGLRESLAPPIGEFKSLKAERQRRIPLQNPDIVMESLRSEPKSMARSEHGVSCMQNGVF